MARCSGAVDNAEAWASGVEEAAGEDSSEWEPAGLKEEIGSMIAVAEVVEGTADGDLGGETMTSRSARVSRRLTCGRSGRCWRKWTLTVCRS